MFVMFVSSAIQSLVGGSLGPLLAQASVLGSGELPFSPVKLVFVLGWFCFCLYLVQRVDDNPLVPVKYRSTVQVASLLVGPLIFMGLRLMDATRSGKLGGSSLNAAGKPNGPGGASGRAKNPWADLVPRAKSFLTNLFKRPAKTVDAAKLQLFDASGTELSQIYGHGDGRTASRHILDLTVQIIDNALQQRASDILIDPIDQSLYAVRLRIDGALRTVRQLPGETSRSVINSVKAVSSMDISERRRPQDGAFTAKRGEVKTSFRVATAGALNGEKLSVRVLNQNAGGFTLADVGIPEHQRAAIVNALGKPSGTVLVCGPTGSGKTTTLYSMLNQIDRMTHNVITVEDPIEAHLKDCSQIEINAKADITFAKALRSILRQDPDVICVGEIRDEETASIALRAAQTGHLVLATIHCDSNATALIRLLDLGVSPLLLSSGLSLLVSQRLIRKLCEQCKKPAQLSPNMLEQFHKSGIDTENISAAVGCDYCGGTGYYGRMAICDLLPISNELRAEIASSGTIMNKLRTDGEKKGKATLKSEALRYVIEGLTTLEELRRVVG